MRAKERLGMDVNKEIRQSLIAKIQNNKLEFVERQSVRITVWRTILNGINVRLVYDKNRKTIVTVLIEREE